MNSNSVDSSLREASLVAASTQPILEVTQGIEEARSPEQGQVKTTRATSRFRISKIILIIGLCIGLALLLSACDYPGQDPPCVGANKNAEGCADPVQKIVDDQNGGPWYVSWALDIVRSILSSVSINAVRLGISVFWQVFTNLSSTDFASCTSGSGGAGNSPTCSAANVFAIVNTVAVLFLPVILFYKIFKSFFLGGLIEPLHEGFLSFFPKLLIGGFVMYFLAVIFSGGFGVSNILFDTIIGGAQSLNDISKNLLGDCAGDSVCGAGIGSVGNVKNIGLLLFMTVTCLLAAVVFIILGLVFFLRTIIIFILFAISPLAVVAGLTEEFKPWFGRWMSSVQAMLIAPIPVAICFALVKAFTGTIPSAQGDPSGFILQLVYIISFLSIGAILMFKIAGDVGGLAFGLAAAGLGTIAGYGVGAALGKGGGTEKSDSSQTDDGSSSNRTGSDAVKKNPGRGSLGTATSSSGATTSGESSSAASSAGGVSLAGAGLGAGMSSAGADQQQRQLLNALRSLNESMSSSAMARAPLPVPASGLQGGRVLKGNYGSGGGNNFAHNTAFNVQSGVLWAGNQAGVSAPYFRLGPDRGNGSGGGSGYPRSEGATYNQHNNFFGPNSGANPGPDPQKPEPEVVGQGPELNEGSFIQPVGSTPSSQPARGSTPSNVSGPAYPTTGTYPQPPGVKQGSAPAGDTNHSTPPTSLSSASVNPPARRVKVTGVIPDPYGAGNSNSNPTGNGNSRETLVIGSARSSTGSTGSNGSIQQP